MHRGTLRVVSDGSYKARRGTAAFIAGGLLLFEDACPEDALRFDIERAGQIVEDKQFGGADKHACRGCALR